MTPWKYKLYIRSKKVAIMRNYKEKILKNGTKTNMHFGDVIILGTLNNSEITHALIKMFPYEVQVRCHTHDLYCPSCREFTPKEATFQQHTLLLQVT